MRLNKQFILIAVLLCAINSSLAFYSKVSDEHSCNFVSSLGQQLVNFVHETVNNLRYSVYKFGGTLFDPTRGVYVLDCSNYVDHILQEIYPNAYLSLVNSSGSEQPNSRHYYDFFKRLAHEPDHYWNKIRDVRHLQAGDILVFRSKNSRRRADGHVMVVMDRPIHDSGTFLIQVADSAPVGHTEDTRQMRESGIGIGTLLLKVNLKTGEPSAYAWKVGSIWKKNVAFAMARPNEIDV